MGAAVRVMLPRCRETRKHLSNYSSEVPRKNTMMCRRRRGWWIDSQKSVSALHIVSRWRLILRILCSLWIALRILSVIPVVTLAHDELARWLQGREHKLPRQEQREYEVTC